jgi:hypothetical protein
MMSDRRLDAGRYGDWRQLRQCPQSQALYYLLLGGAEVRQEREQQRRDAGQRLIDHLLQDRRQSPLRGRDVVVAVATTSAAAVAATSVAAVLWKSMVEN